MTAQPWTPSYPYASTVRADCEDGADALEPTTMAVVIQHPSAPHSKPCTACNESLPLSAYAADGRARDRRQSMCRVCQVARRRAQRKPRRIANLLAEECGVMTREDVYSFIAREAGNGRRIDRQAVIRMAGLTMRRDANGARVYRKAEEL